MNAFLTLDYELFFGSRVGSTKNCLIRPTDALLEQLEPLNIPVIFFVDISFLDAAKQKNRYKDEVRGIFEHLQTLQRRGHEIQLHIHPHWYYSMRDDGSSVTNLQKYKMIDLTHDEANSIVYSTSNLFREICGQDPLAYRAGGWCIQGFESFADAMYECGVRVDSTLYRNGVSHSKFQGYDFRDMPNYPYWRFNQDPAVPVPQGRFLELPISSVKLPNIFYWERVIREFFPSRADDRFSDGTPTSMSLEQFIKFMAFGSHSVASVDGLKSRTLGKALRSQRKFFAERGAFVILGHPKALTVTSIRNLAEFVRRNINELNFTTIREWYAEIRSTETPRNDKNVTGEFAATNDS